MLKVERGKELRVKVLARRPISRGRITIDRPLSDHDRGVIVVADILAQDPTLANQIAACKSLAPEEGKLKNNDHAAIVFIADLLAKDPELADSIVNYKK